MRLQNSVEQHSYIYTHKYIYILFNYLFIPHKPYLWNFSIAQLLLIKMKSNTGRLPDSSGCVWLSLAPELTGARTVLLSLLPVQAGSCSTWLGLGESGACIHTDALADWLKLVGSGTCIEGCQNCLVESSASIYG